MAQKKKPTKRNPQDLTLRNLRAMKARYTTLESRVLSLEERNQKFGPRIQALEEKVRDLQEAQPVSITGSDGHV